MKISDFNKKPLPKRRKKEAQVFNLTNDRKEQQLGERINDLEARLKDAHSEISNLDPFKHQYKEVSSVLEEKEGAITRLQANSDSQEASLEALRAKIGELSEYKQLFESKDYQYNSAISEVKNLKKVLNDEENAIIALKKQVIDAKNSFSDLDSSHSKLVTDFDSLTDSFNVIKYQNDSFEDILTELKDKYITVVDDNKSLELDCQALLNDNRSARAKIKELDSFRVQLSTWNKKLTKDTTEATSKSSALNKKFEGQEKVMKEMSEYINNLIQDREDLTKLNDYLKFELKKPKYSPSTTLLSRKMGMPTSKENIRTEYLGTGSPTMLKFAAKEETNA